MFSSKTRDVITLFHKASVPASTRVVTLLKQSSAIAAHSATEDQASDHSAQNKIQRSEFDLDITETLPTKDQFRSILDYIGAKNAGKLVKGATNESDALKKFSESADSFQRPVVVDWSNGRAVQGENESEIIKMLNATHDA